ncbi:MAG: helix-hairpin-helix domain-containing protein [Salegentibacter sp.]
MVLIIIALQLIYFFVDFSSEEIPEGKSDEIEHFQQKIDSLKLAGVKKDSLKLLPFNPNFITDYKGYVLGMTTEEIDRLQDYRKQGRWINSAEDFRKVTGVSDSLLQAVSPYFKFPEWKRRNEERGRESIVVAGIAQKQDLNSATAEDLQQISGIGEVLSTRIVSYRSKLGGFVDEIQLKDVWGLNADLRKKIAGRFAIKQKPQVQILNINEAGVLPLSEVPYFNYELAREIVDYRDLHEGITSFEELAKIRGFPSDKIERIQLYLTLR